MAMPTIWVKFTLWLQSPQRDKFFNVFYYEVNNTPAWTLDWFADAVTIGQEIYDTISPNLASVLSTVDHKIGGVCELHVGTLVYSVMISPEPVTGTVSSDQLPDYCAVVIQKRTGVGGRSGRGRWFLGPVPESLTDENFLTEAAIALYNAVAINWGTAVAALESTWQPSLHSAKEITLVPLETNHVNSALGVIRGRKSRPGL